MIYGINGNEILKGRTDMDRMNEIERNVTVIIPSLNPDEKLLRVVCGLEALGFDDIIIVNDGSAPEYLKNFPSEEEHRSCTLLTHPTNRGKGAALRTAFEYFLKNRQGKLGAVSVDGDDQHRPADVLKCCEKMAQTGSLVLGVRDFSLPQVPRRSRLGNRITSFVFKIGCGLRISDTQTGLRAFPTEYIPDMLEISGDRYEYETNMLLSLGDYSIPMSEVTIETVYIEDNRASHFRPVRDSMRIYSLILKFVASSAVCAVFEEIVFYIFMKLFADFFGTAAVTIGTFSARLLSSILNFNINRARVFGKSSESTGRVLAKYYTLAVILVTISSLSVTGITRLFGIDMPSLTTLIKVAVDIILFVCSFRFQREWVFSKKKKRN